MRLRSHIGRSAWQVLKHSDFRLYFMGSLISNLGTWLQNTAQVLFIYQLTHSVFAVGVVTCAQFSGFLVLGHWAAVMASRIGGKRLLIGTQVFSAAVAAALALEESAGRLGERSLILGALLLGLAFTFALPVQTSLAPKLVGKPETEAAMAMNSVSYNAGRALAPALSVGLIITIGFAWVFALNALSFAIFSLTLMRGWPRTFSRPSQRPRARDGLIIALMRPRILVLLAMVAAVTLADDPVLTLGADLAHHVLGVSHNWAGYFLSALGLGTILGAFRPTARRHSFDTSKRAAWSLLFLAVAIIVFSLGISVWVSLLAAFVAGVAALWTGAVTQTQLVRHAPKERHAPEENASIMALWAIAWAGTKPIASFADGWLAGRFGVVPAAVVLTAPALCLAGVEICLRGSWELRVKNRARYVGFRLQEYLGMADPGGGKD